MMCVPLGVWLVWVEEGEYEQWQNVLHGIFISKDLADKHQQQLGKGEVKPDTVLTMLPTRVLLYLMADRVTLQGMLSPSGESRRESYMVWSYEFPVVESRIVSWSSRLSDLYIETWGTDEEVVKRKHQELIEEARRRLSLLT